MKRGMKMQNKSTSIFTLLTIHAADPQSHSVPGRKILISRTESCQGSSGAMVETLSLHRYQDQGEGGRLPETFIGARALERNSTDTILYAR